MSYILMSWFNTTNCLWRKNQCHILTVDKKTRLFANMTAACDQKQNSKSLLHFCKLHVNLNFDLVTSYIGYSKPAFKHETILSEPHGLQNPFSTSTHTAHPLTHPIHCPVIGHIVFHRSPRTDVKSVGYTRKTIWKNRPLTLLKTRWKFNTKCKCVTHLLYTAYETINKWRKFSRPYR